MFVPPAPPSPEVEDLGMRIADLVRTYRETRPQMSRHEVRQALGVAHRALHNELGGGGGSARSTAILAIFLGMGVFAGILAYASRQGSIPQNAVTPAIVAGMIVMVFLMMMVRRM
jgi:hypothetical protein